MAADLAIGTQELFNNPEFDVQLTEWQRCHLYLSERDKAFCETVEEEFGGKDRERRGPEDTVEYICQMSIRDFKEPGNFYRDMLSDDALRAHDVRVLADEQLERAKSELVALGERLGVSSFALWGLAEHFRPFSRDISRPTLLAKTKIAEERFLFVDKLVRNNSGAVLTIVNDPFSLEASRLGSGGIELRDDTVYFPIAEDAHVVSMLPAPGSDSIYTESNLTARALDIARRQPVILEADTVLRVEQWHDGRTGVSLFLGDSVLGPPYIEREQSRDHLTYILQKMRAVTERAFQQ